MGIGCGNDGIVHIRTGITGDMDFSFSPGGVQTTRGLYALDLVMIGPDESKAPWITTTQTSGVHLRCSSLNVLSMDAKTYVPVAASAFNTYSSRRYKENIKDIIYEEAKKILDVNVATFDYIHGQKNCCGVIAEDLNKIIPSVVSKNDDGKPESVDYSKLVPYLISIVQMQQKEIDYLKSRIDEL